MKQVALLIGSHDTEDLMEWEVSAESWDAIRILGKPQWEYHIMDPWVSEEKLCHLQMRIIYLLVASFWSLLLRHSKYLAMVYQVTIWPEWPITHWALLDVPCYQFGWIQQKSIIRWTWCIQGCNEYGQRALENFINRCLRPLWHSTLLYKVWPQLTPMATWWDEGNPL